MESVAEGQTFRIKCIQQMCKQCVDTWIKLKHAMISNNYNIDRPSAFFQCPNCKREYMAICRSILLPHTRPLIYTYSQLIATCVFRYGYTYHINGPAQIFLLTSIWTIFTGEDGEDRIQETWFDRILVIVGFLKSSYRSNACTDKLTLDACNDNTRAIPCKSTKPNQDDESMVSRYFFNPQLESSAVVKILLQHDCTITCHIR